MAAALRPARPFTTHCKDRVLSRQPHRPAKQPTLSSVAGNGETAPSCRQGLLLERARQLYEVAWSTPRGALLLDAIMAPDHAQVDAVWQPGRRDGGEGDQEGGGGGRRRMKRGILAYRAAYPDITFVVRSIAAVPDGDEVFVHWTASGTNTGPIRDQPPSGRRVEFAGMSLLRFNTDGQIRESLVFRQAPEDEARYFTGRGP